MSRFALTLLLDRGKNDAHYRMVRVLNPDLTLRGPVDCPAVRAIEAFLTAQPGVRVVRARGDALQLTVPLNGEHFNVPLPDMVAGDTEQPQMQPQMQQQMQPQMQQQMQPQMQQQMRQQMQQQMQQQMEPQTQQQQQMQRRLARWFCRRPPVLREHQKDLLKALAQRDFAARHAPAFLIMWEMGSGKTLGALALLMDRLSRRNVIVCSNTNIEYWADTLRRVDAPAVPDTERNLVLSFDLVGYTAFRATFDDRRAMRNVSCVLIDEAHHYRNSTVGMQCPIQCLQSAKNVVLLTGTPIVNDVGDVDGMLQLMDMDQTMTRAARPTPARVTQLLQGHVSWFDPRVHRPLMFEQHYPATEDTTVQVPMHAAQTLEYLMSLRSTFRLGPYDVQHGRANRYNALTRAVCNAPSACPETSPKLRAVVDRVLALRAAHPDARQVVHSSLVETGVKPLLQMLRAVQPPLRLDILTGETETAARDGIRCRYNQGKLDVLLISDASQQGMDLAGTLAIHLVEPFQNKALMMQTRARVIRMDSHRKSDVAAVLCFMYVSTFPRAVTAADEPALQAYALRAAVLGTNTAAMLRDITLYKEVQRMMREEGGLTVNERQMQHNERKHQEIEPYTQAFRAASVPMSVQKEKVMFADMKDTQDPDELSGGSVSAAGKAVSATRRARASTALPTLALVPRRAATVAIRARCASSGREPTGPRGRARGASAASARGASAASARGGASAASAASARGGSRGGLRGGAAGVRQSFYNVKHVLKPASGSV
jgi:superfamily II DNA or RNA helicase